MQISLTPAEQELQESADAYFSTLMTPEQQDEYRHDEFGTLSRSITRQMGADGWLGHGWPEEFGGRAMDAVAEQVVVNSAFRHRVPYPLITVHSVGPALQKFGTEEQKEFFLGPILRGEINFCIGYSEPSAGTDLAALQTSAVRDGDFYVLNGQKTLMSGAHNSDYIWLGCRTAVGDRKHDGISILIVDTKLPGISWTPIHTINGSPTINAVYFDNVRVPANRLVGTEGRGWRLVTSQLNSERSVVGPAGRADAHADRFAQWAAGTAAPDGAGRIIDILEIRRVLGRLRGFATANEVLNWKVCSGNDLRDMDPAEASVTKVYTSERLLRVAQLVATTVRRWGDMRDGATAKLLADVDNDLKSEMKLTVGGGANEIQRELIGMLGLGLPKPLR